MTEESRSIDLEDTFFLHDDSSKRCILKLLPNILSITVSNNDNSNASSSTSSTRLILIDDIYGCLCMKSTKKSNQCHLTFYLYALRQSRGVFSKKARMHRSRQIFTYAKFDDFERNLAEVTRWHRLVTYAIYLRRNLPQDIVATKRDKRVLAFINPAGGSGRAHRLFMEHVIGVWSEAEFPYQTVITEYAGHARDYVQSIELDNWSGIVVASGDGLIYEVINGLMSRTDWQKALKLPIGHLPCGSGNAFITNIIHQAKQPPMDSMENFVVQAAVLIATHDVVPFDLALVDTCDGQRIFSFLSVEWGIIADVDCESEQYRFLGETRFTVEGIKQILRRRVYNGHVDYLPYDKADDTAIENQITPTMTTAQLHRHLLPLNEPIPIDPATSKWRRIEGPFSHVLVSSKGYLSKNALATPPSTLADGFLTLQFVRSSAASRGNLMKILTGLPDGKHFDFDFVEWMPVRAFRIVPTETQGNIMLDGEKVAYGPIQGEILSGLARCMGKLPKRDLPVATA